MKAVYLYPGNTLNHMSFQLNFHSDNLFGLICWAIRLIYSEDNLIKLLSKFDEDVIPFSISSTFPFFYERVEQKPTNITHFLPKPIIEYKIENINDDYKAFKKLKYLREDDFNNLINGKSSLIDILSRKEDGWSKYSDLIKESKIEIVHNTINRITNSTMEEGGLYTQIESVLNKNGLFFLINDTEDNIIENSIMFLKDYGFGTKRTSGKNHFEVYVDQNTDLIKEPTDPNCFMVLSNYFPTDEEIKYYMTNSDNRLLNYDLSIREGIIPVNLVQTNKLRKKGIVTFKEASIFPIMDNNTHYGKTFPIETINENHKIYFYGNPTIVKMKI